MPGQRGKRLGKPARGRWLEVPPRRQQPHHRKVANDLHCSARARIGGQLQSNFFPSRLAKGAGT